MSVVAGTGPQAHVLPGHRLHLHHGPIDLILMAEGPRGARGRAFDAARARFGTVLTDLVAELPLLRQPTGTRPRGAIARAMYLATLPHRAVFVTPMAAVAGAVADTVLAAMIAGADGPLSRASVNNGGDIAVHLTGAAMVRIGVSGLTGTPLARLTLTAADAARGLATSGTGGRSQTLGIADAVSVVAASAAAADAAATLIANAVDLPGHSAIRRIPACELHPDSDLGLRPVTTAVGALSPVEIDRALASGRCVAEAMRQRGLIASAGLFLRGRSVIVGPASRFSLLPQRTPAHV